MESIALPRSSSVMQAGLLAAIAEAKLEVNQPPKGKTTMPYLVKPILVIIMSVGAALFLGHSFVQPSLERTITLEPSAGNPNEGHYRGASNVPITLVEYGDYACPACATYNSVLNDVLKKYGDRVRLEFRHYPLKGIHPNAMPAALAAEAAGEQGHYWEMHDLLFSSQAQWAPGDANPEAAFAKLAASIGLDANKFLQDLGSPELQQRVSNDVKRGQETSVAATPTFFLNGRRIERIAPTLEAFQTLIEAER
jgi:protein-disulfide isomerase